MYYIHSFPQFRPELRSLSMRRAATTLNRPRIQEPFSRLYEEEKQIDARARTKKGTLSSAEALDKSTRATPYDSRFQAVFHEGRKTARFAGAKPASGAR
jgi:hypothetical protein